MDSKIALITGGSRGIGRDAAIRLAQKGNNIILTYHSKATEATAVVAEIEALGQNAVAMQLDVADIKSLPIFIEKIANVLHEKWHRSKFDFLINNAGTGATIPFTQATEDDFDRLLNVHFKGVYFLTQKALPLMNDQGSIINVSSGTTRFCNPGYSIYASMKGAMETLTKYLAKELGTRGINVNIVAPGPIETDFNNAFIRSNPEIKNRLASFTALGRVGEANDIGGIIAFLCSTDAKWINAQRIEASGGVNI